ncbi:MAG: hypothetical protein M1377_00240 [Deltaproteobacteria bacterium]|nr:hypothetical protein [Deltaproteobacteria bacterium]
MTLGKPRRNIWDLVRTTARVGFPLLRGDTPSSVLELFLAVFGSPYAKRYEEYIEGNLKDVNERLGRLEEILSDLESPALSEADSRVLAVLCEIAVEADRDFIVEDPAEFTTSAAREGIDANALLRAIRFLEEVGYVKGLYHVNMSAEEIPRVRLLHEGFDRYLRDTYAGYGDLYKMVVWFLVLELKDKESVRYSEVIANSSFPPVYVIHVLDDLSKKELVKTKIQDYPCDMSLVYGVSETLRRAITP